MSANHHPSMHHFTSEEPYRDFVDALAETEADAIHAWVHNEVANNVIARIDDHSDNIQVGGGSAPEVVGVDGPTLSHYRVRIFARDERVTP